ncbi:hypothetical protein EX30DRAFT_341899 [Ascodesmis nigricans]|uniref:Uncharacterized protein n=1 Tax=Ascodesmis nigricans TaxID=341454 RepID=A0A4S2MU66_9PEZI|nr:hypothetical protein EX30DRAFT_341899 [Ascodesmis nigricans]
MKMIAVPFTCRRSDHMDYHTFNCRFSDHPCALTSQLYLGYQMVGIQVAAVIDSTVA